MAPLGHPDLLANAFGAWKFTPTTTTIDLIAASANALNGAFLARRPDHYRGYSIAGIIALAVFGGIGGGIARDVLLNTVPSPLLNPAYIVLAVAAGLVGYFIAFDSGQRFRSGTFEIVSAFALPWYAIVGAQKATHDGLPVIAAILIGVVGATTGRYLIDITSGKTPKHFVPNDFFVGTAVVAATAWLALDALGMTAWPSTLIAFVLAFAVHYVAMRTKWRSPMPHDQPAQRPPLEAS